MFLLFLLIWKDISLLPTYPKTGSKSCSSPQKFRLVSWIDFKSLKKCFGEDKKPKGVEELKM